MAKSDLREWLTLNPADVPCCLAAACCAGMYFAQDFTLDLVLAIAALFLAVLACLLGMKQDARLSRFTNVTKKVTYPLLVLAVLAAIAANFLVWPQLSALPASPSKGPKPYLLSPKRQ